MTNLEKIRQMSAEEMAEFLQCVYRCALDILCELCAANFICDKIMSSKYELIRKLNAEVEDGTGEEAEQALKGSEKT